MSCDDLYNFSSIPNGIPFLSFPPRRSVTTWNCNLAAENNPIRLFCSFAEKGTMAEWMMQIWAEIQFTAIFSQSVLKLLTSVLCTGAPFSPLASYMYSFGFPIPTRERLNTHETFAMKSFHILINMYIVILHKTTFLRRQWKQHNFIPIFTLFLKSCRYFITLSKKNDGKAIFNEENHKWLNTIHAAITKNYCFTFLLLYWFNSLDFLKKHCQDRVT